MDQVVDAIEEFDKKMRMKSVPPDQFEVAKYAVCVKRHAIAQQTPSPERHVWVRYSRLTRFFKERQGAPGRCAAIAKDKSVVDDQRGGLAGSGDFVYRLA